MKKSALLFFWGICLHGIPTGPAVVSGEAQISSPNPQSLDVAVSHRSIINWSDFSISPSETARFLQPSPDSVVLNRVIGTNLSELMGTLSANGIVYLINPNGILVGKDGIIDTAGFLGSTLDLSNASFICGDLKFEGGSGESLTVLGTIRAASGHVHLISHRIVNEGEILAPSGTVSMTSAHEVFLKDDRFPLVQVKVDLHGAGIENRGAIEAVDAILQSDNPFGFALHQEGTVRLVQEGGKTLLRTSGGEIQVSAGASIQAPAGEIRIEIPDEGRPLYLMGSLDVSGTTGGAIEIDVPRCIVSGELLADGIDGGKISFDLKGPFIETGKGLMRANGELHGGEISVLSTSSVFSSGSHLACGENGGRVFFLGEKVGLAGALAKADGLDAGGEILVGGDARGQNILIPNADTVLINHTALLSADGGRTGGKVVVFSTGKTQNGASISASSPGGKGGFIEVSGKELTHYGNAQALGTGGELLLDPQYIIIDEPEGSFYELIDPHLGSGSSFGKQVYALPNGNIVVTKPNDNFAAANSGAVYEYDYTTAQTIAIVTGSSVSDQVGLGGITILGNGNYVIKSPSWNNTAPAAAIAGAATFAIAGTGVTGTISGANSLVGTNPNDNIASGGTITNHTNGQVLTYDGVEALLVNGNYVVVSPNWNGAAAQGGAVTWGSGTTGITGPVSIANSYYGTTATDTVGVGGVTPLTNGHYVVMSPNWSIPAGTPTVGAVTWGDGNTGSSGMILPGNSLTGFTTDDMISSAINLNAPAFVYALSNGNYAVTTPNWFNSMSGAMQAGAVTWRDGSMSTSGVISQAISLYGVAPTDRVGWATGASLLENTYLTVLKGNGNYVASSFSLGGAVWINGSNGQDANGAGPGQFFDSAVNMFPATRGGPIVPLENGNYVVGSYQGNVLGQPMSSGFAQWIDGTNGMPAGAIGVIGPPTTASCLYGSTLNDFVGSSILPLANGNYIVCSQFWDNGAIMDVGAVTWVDGVTAIPFSEAGIGAAVSTTNSFYGTMANDIVGNGIPTALTNGNFVISSNSWNQSVGAATFGIGSAPGSGGQQVSAANSLVGTTPGDAISLPSIVALANGNYLVCSSGWNSGQGAATFGDGAAGITGVVTPANSLIGTSLNDQVGSGRAVTFSNGDYVVYSPFWTASTGAATFGSGTTGVVGPVSGCNSLVGASVNSLIQTPVANNVDGTYIVAFLNNNGQSQVEVGITDLNTATYANLPGVVFHINPCLITNSLNAGTNVVLQANDDISVLAPILVAAATGPAGSLTLSAGRSVLIEADIDTDGGSLIVTANDTLANGVVDAYRDPGSAVISLKAGTKILLGSGSLSFSLLGGAGKTNSASGDISLGTNTAILADGPGSISIFAEEHNIAIQNFAQIQTEDGSITLIAGQSFLANGAIASVSTIGSGDLTLVVDNLFPASPGFGNGGIFAPFTTFSAGGKLKFYTVAPSLNFFSGSLNGASFVHGTSALLEQYGIYYPDGIGGIPFTIFYKIPFDLFFFYESDGEVFRRWREEPFDPYFCYDLYPPYKTPKGLFPRYRSLLEWEDPLKNVILKVKE